MQATISHGRMRDVEVARHTGGEDRERDDGGGAKRLRARRLRQKHGQVGIAELAVFLGIDESACQGHQGDEDVDDVMGQHRRDSDRREHHDAEHEDEFAE